MRHKFLRFTLLLFVASTAAAQTADWHQYKNEAGNFSALLPGQPTDTDNAPDSKDVVGSRTVTATENGVSLNVIYVILRDQQEVTEENLQAYKEGFLKQLPGCSVSSEKPASPAVPGYVGHLYRMDCTISNTKMNFSGNIYWGKHYSYAVLGMFASAPTDPPGVKKFLDSFAVIDSSK
jgi:hypothetical protein